MHCHGTLFSRFMRVDLSDYVFSDPWHPSLKPRLGESVLPHLGPLSLYVIPLHLLLVRLRTCFTLVSLISLVCERPVFINDFSHLPLSSWLQDRHWSYFFNYQGRANLTLVQEFLSRIGQSNARVNGASYVRGHNIVLIPEIIGWASGVLPLKEFCFSFLTDESTTNMILNKNHMS